MNLQTEYVRVLNVKAVIYDLKSGLLLVQTVKSAKDARWTLAGGEIGWHEDPIDGIVRKVKEEIGVSPVRVDSQPVYVKTFNSPREEKRITIQSYLAEIPRTGPLSADKGTTQTGLPFEFFQFEDIFNRSVPITTKTYNVLHSGTFFGRYRELKRKGQN